MTEGTAARARRRAVLVVLPLLAAPLILTSGATSQASTPGLAAPQPSTQTAEQRDLKLREEQAAEDLETSSAEVQAAAGALRVVATQLPAAQADVARARGELAGARARAARAAAAVARAEQALARARSQTDAASARVDEGRAGVNRLARRAYQRGALSELRDVIDANKPEDVLVRAGLLKAVFRDRNDTLARLADDRLRLARTRAEVTAEERGLERARAEADRVSARARRVTAEAESAAARVADLVARRAAAVEVAEANREQDVQSYRAAQRASAELAAQIRAAARRAAAAAAAEARRRAAAAAAEAAADAAADAAAAADARRRNQPPPPRKARPSRTAPRSGQMLWPTPGRLTSRFGYRTHPIYGDRRLHAGIDISGPVGQSIRAADAGVVIIAGDGGGYGNLTVISHGSRGGRDLTTSYAHQSRILVRVGQVVGRGEQIGEVGGTGNVTGPHLHFETRLDGEPVDPLGYVSPP